jgi:3-hydroxyisobutyrate dehydrogenase-like beta-hydroxyacid dehydrogenase
MAATRTRIGFLGLGHMGGSMAVRFLAAGYPVYGEERSREHAQHLLQEGLRWCNTPREVAEEADVVFTSVADDRVLEEVASGRGRHPRRSRRREDVGRHEHRQPGESRELAERVRAQGAWMLDAPLAALFQALEQMADGDRHPRTAHP